MTGSGGVSEAEAYAAAARAFGHAPPDPAAVGEAEQVKGEITESADAMADAYAAAARAFGREPASVSPELRAAQEAAAAVFGRAPAVDATLLKDFRAVGLSEAGAASAAFHVGRGDSFELAASLASAFDDSSWVDSVAVARVVEARKPKAAVPVRSAPVLPVLEAGKRRMTEAEYQRMQPVFNRLVDANEACHGTARDAAIKTAMVTLKECQAITVARAETFSQFLRRMDERAVALRSSPGVNPQL